MIQTITFSQHKEMCGSCTAVVRFPLPQRRVQFSTSTNQFLKSWHPILKEKL